MAMAGTKTLELISPLWSKVLRCLGFRAWCLLGFLGVGGVRLPAGTCKCSFLSAFGSSVLTTSPGISSHPLYQASKPFVDLLLAKSLELPSKDSWLELKTYKLVTSTFHLKMANTST